MKKLMKTVVASAVALVASGAFATLPSPTADFESIGMGTKTVSDLVENSLDKYWFAITNSSQELNGDIGVVTNNSVAARGKFLTLDASAPVYRAVNEVEGAGFGDVVSGLTTETIGSNGVYLDTWVKFTVSSDEFKAGDLDADVDKLAITCYSEDESGVTNILVRAGYVVGSTITATNYFLNLPQNFNIDEWQRLTVRAIANTGSQVAPVGFAIYIGGELLEYESAQAAGDSAYETAIAGNSTIATYLYNSQTHAFLPSLIDNTYNDCGVLSAVGFKGTGSVDDIVFLATKPEGLPDEGILVTVDSGEGVSAVTITVGEDEIPGDNGVYTLPTGTTAFYLDVDWNEAEGYTSGTIMTGGTPITTREVSVSGDMTITIKGVRDNFAFIDDNGDSVTASTLTDAFSRVGDGETIVLAYNYDVASEGVSTVYVISDKEITLDLHGNTITGGANTDEALFTVNAGASLTVVDTVGGGKIEDETEYGIFLVDGDVIIGDASATDNGVTIDGILDCGDSSSDMTIIRGSFDAASNSEAGAFKWTVDDNSECSDEPVNGYWVVTPNGGSEPTMASVPTAETGLVYDGTEKIGVVAGTGYTLTGNIATNAGNYTATATLEEGYIWSDSTTAAKLIDWSIAVNSGATVDLTLASEIAEYSELLEFPVVTSAKVGTEDVTGTPEWSPAKISEPNAGETNTYTVTFTVMNGGYTGSTGTATFKVFKAAGGGGEDWPADPAEVSGQTAADAFGITGDLATADAGVLATWAKAKGVNFADRTTAILEDAFLLNCANTQEAIDEAKANFKVTSITVVGDTVTITPADAADYGNGQIVIEGAAAITSPMSWHTKTTGDKFFRATLVVKPVTP